MSAYRWSRSWRFCIVGRPADRDPLPASRRSSFPRRERIFADIGKVVLFSLPRGGWAAQSALAAPSAAWCCRRGRVGWVQVAGLWGWTALACVVGLAVSVPAGFSWAEPLRYHAPRTAFGAPDLQGYWTNASRTSLERRAGAPLTFSTRAEEAAFEDSVQAECELATDLKPSVTTRPHGAS